jgi:hypothetical protein
MEASEPLALRFETDSIRLSQGESSSFVACVEDRSRDSVGISSRDFLREE